MKDIKVNATYRHYKGNFYKVLGLAKHSENLEYMVVYQSVKNGDLWVRPAKMWNEIVDENGTKRFTEYNTELI